MRITLKHTLGLATLPLAALGAVKRATTDFQLYAYGDSFGGLPVFYSKGFAYAGDPSLTNDTNAAIVMFHTGANNTWIGSPNTTSLSSDPNWSDVTLYIPDSSLASQKIGFLDSNSSSNGTVETSGFSLYGNTVLFSGKNRPVSSSFTGLMLNTGVFQLYWNDTSSGQIPLTLRSTPPSNPPSGQRV